MYGRSCSLCMRAAVQFALEQTKRCVPTGAGVNRVCVFVFVHMYIHTYICIYIYTYTADSARSARGPIGNPTRDGRGGKFTSN